MNTKSIQLHELMLSRGTFFCYSGPLSEQVLTSISAVVKDQLTDSESDLSIKTKVFGIFIEQAQNIIRYSGARVDKSGVGSVSISHTDTGFMLESVNEINGADKQRVAQLLAELKEMDSAQLKAAYKERIKNGPPAGSTGAGLGFIEVARRSSRFDYAFEQHNGADLFIYRGWVDTK
jgi:hypothetical protein